MFYQSPAGLHQPLLQPRERQVFDPLKQDKPSAQIPQIVSD